MIFLEGGIQNITFIAMSFEETREVRPLLLGMLSQVCIEVALVFGGRLLVMLIVSEGWVVTTRLFA